jgi:hypothetical protein
METLEIVFDERPSTISTVEDCIGHLLSIADQEICSSSVEEQLSRRAAVPRVQTR